MKKCTVCQQEKSLSDFHKKGANGHHGQCKPCRKKERTRYRESDFSRNLRTRYNITVERYEELFAAQGSTCGVCQSREPQGSPFWQVDHNHACCPGKNSCGSCVRGILCFDCNMLLGFYEKVSARADIGRSLKVYLDNPARSV